MTIMRRCRPALVCVFIFSLCISSFAQGSAGVLNFEAKGHAAINQSDIAAARDKAIEEEANITVFLEAKGLKKYSDFLYLKNFLKKQAKMVKNIHSRSFKWRRACLELEISGTAQALAVELDKTGRYLLNTEQIEKNQIVLNLLQEEGNNSDEI